MDALRQGVQGNIADGDRRQRLRGVSTEWRDTGGGRALLRSGRRLASTRASLGSGGLSGGTALFADARGELMRALRPGPMPPPPQSAVAHIAKVNPKPLGPPSNQTLHPSVLDGLHSCRTFVGRRLHQTQTFTL